MTIPASAPSRSKTANPATEEFKFAGSTMDWNSMPSHDAGTVHRFTNTTDVLATIEEVLKLDALSQFDHYGRPLREIWSKDPDLRPYTTLVPSVSLDAKNPPSGRDARESAKLDFDFEDVADEEAFNRILWRTIKGEAVPYPGTNRMSALEWKRGW